MHPLDSKKMELQSLQASSIVNVMFRLVIQMLGRLSMYADELGVLLLFYSCYGYNYCKFIDSSRLENFHPGVYAGLECGNGINYIFSNIDKH